MANGILNVLSNVRKLSQGFLNGSQELLNQKTGAKMSEVHKNILSYLSREVKPFVVDIEMLDLVDTLVAPKSLINRLGKSTETTVQTTEKEYHDILDKFSVVSHLMKLPYEHVWVEVANERSNTGVYLYESQDDLGNYLIECVVVSVHKTGRDKVLHLPKVCFHFIPSFCDDKSVFKTYALCENVTDDELFLFSSGVVLKSLGVILALNSPKIVSTTTEKMITKLANTNGNKKHVASDVIKVSVSKELRKQLNADKDLENEASRKGMRAHYVRGHFKVTRTGMFWWNAHIRGVGQPSEKTYELTS